MAYVVNIHEGLPLPEDRPRDVYLVKGDYEYYHYNCDGFDDRGWGCGYRTLQTICSWVRRQQLKDQTQPEGAVPCPVPSLPQIQESLFAMKDKPGHFVGSREWIGSVEVGLVVEYFYQVCCKIHFLNSGRDLPRVFNDLEEHFFVNASPVMMGGNIDAASKGILGTCRGEHNNYVLILDPHYHGSTPTKATLVDNDMLMWRKCDDFINSSFYNLCMPQLKGR